MHVQIILALSGMAAKDIRSSKSWTTGFTSIVFFVLICANQWWLTNNHSGKTHERAGVDADALPLQMHDYMSYRDGCGHFVTLLWLVSHSHDLKDRICMSCIKARGLLEEGEVISGTQWEFTGADYAYRAGCQVWGSGGVRCCCLIVGWWCLDEVCGGDVGTRDFGALFRSWAQTLWNTPPSLTCTPHLCPKERRAIPPNFEVPMMDNESEELQDLCVKITKWSRYIKVS